MAPPPAGLDSLRSPKAADRMLVIATPKPRRRTIGDRRQNLDRDRPNLQTQRSKTRKPFQKELPRTQTLLPLVLCLELPAFRRTLEEKAPADWPAPADGPAANGAEAPPSRPAGCSTGPPRPPGETHRPAVRRCRRSPAEPTPAKRQLALEDESSPPPATGEPNSNAGGSAPKDEPTSRWATKRPPKPRRSLLEDP